MKKKILAALIISATLSTSVISQAFAKGETIEVNVDDLVIPVSMYYYEQDDDLEQSLLNVEPRFTYIKQLGAGITIDGNTAHVYGQCSTYEKTKISVSVKLQKKVNGIWKDMKSASNSVSNDTFCDISKSYTVESGYEYRTSVTVTANGETSTRASGSDYCK